MKIIVISDTHLHAFEEAKYTYLQKIIASADKVIINGDFWDGYITTFDAFVASPWKMLFPLLRKKGAIYLYGNRDKEQYSDARRKQFCVKAGNQFTLDFGQYSVCFEHGNRIGKKIDDKYPYLQRKRPLGYLGEYYQGLGLALFGWKFVEVENRGINRLYEAYAVSHSKKKRIFMFGHSHFPVLDLDHFYAVSGPMRWTYASYLVIERDTISLVKERYK